MSAELCGIITLGKGQAGLWPLDRDESPFSCRPFFGGKTLLEAAWDRMLVLIPPTRIRVVCPAAAIPLVCAVLPDLDTRMIIPGDGESLASLYAGTLEHVRLQPDALVVCCPAGMIAGDDTAFSDLVHDAARLAHSSGCLVTGTVPASQARAGYSCIHAGDACIRSGPVTGQDVKRFFPRIALDAAGEAASRGAVWSTGIHVWNAASFLADVSTLVPDPEGMQADHGFEDVFLARTRNWLLIPSQLVWDPLRSFEDLARYIREDGAGNCQTGPCLVASAKGCIVLSDNPEALVVLHGMENLLLVQTKDALLCCQRGDEQAVGRLLTRLQEDEAGQRRQHE